MFRNLISLLLQPGNLIVTAAGLMSTVMTVMVITSGTEIVVEERAEAIIERSTNEYRLQFEKQIQDLENDKTALEAKLADVVTNTDPEQCEANSTAAICVYIRKVLDEQRRRLNEGFQEEQNSSQDVAQNDLNAELAKLTQTLNQQCEAKLRDQETRLNSECDRKLAEQKAVLEGEWAQKMRAALIEQAKEHSAELAAQKRMIERLQQLLEEQKEKHAKAIADLKKALRDALAAARKKCAADISNLEKKHAEELAKKCRIID
jgi:hypothetical protein